MGGCLGMIRSERWLARYDEVVMPLQEEQAESIVVCKECERYHMSL